MKQATSRREILLDVSDALFHILGVTSQGPANWGSESKKIILSETHVTDFSPIEKPIGVNRNFGCGRRSDTGYSPMRFFKEFGSDIPTGLQMRGPET